MPDSNPQGQISRLLGQFIIKNRFQFKFGLIMLAITGISCFVLWWEGQLAINRILESGAVSNEDAVIQLRLVSSIVGKTGFIISAISFGVALVWSHFIAGPLYRFERTFMDMRDGNLGMYVRLRKKDDFQETAALFNQAIVSLRNKLQKERESIDESLKKISQNLNSSGQSQAAAELAQLIKDIQNNPATIKLSSPK